MNRILEKSAQYNKMSDMPVKKLVGSLAVPTIISMMVSSIYNMADTFFVSKLGTSASGAIGIVFSLMAIIQAVGFTLGMGAGTTVSRLLGQQKKNEAESVACSALSAAAVLGLIVSIFGLIFVTPLMRLLGSTETILPFAIEYGKYILIAAPLMTMTFVLNNLLRSEGKAKLSMVGITSGSILNIILDPVFIFTLDMGITGAAIATAVGQAVSLIILFSCFISGKSGLKLSFKKISTSPMTYLMIIRNGLPSFCRQGLASISGVMLNHVAAAYGDPAVAAISVSNKVFMMIFSLLIGFGQGYQPVAGYNYGAAKYKRVKEAMLFNMTTGFVMMGSIAAAVYFFAPHIITWFIDDDPEVIRIGTQALRFHCITLPFMPINVTANMTFQSIGKAFTATFLSAFRQGIFFIPSVLILPKLLGLNGVIGVQPASDLLSSLISLPFLIHFIKKLNELIREEESMRNA